MGTKATTPEDNLNNRNVTLDEPVKRGDTEITSVIVRKPGAGELRGISLLALSDMDVTALHKVLPRVTTPMLTQQDIERLAPADLLSLGVAISSFLLPTAQRQEAFPS